jgi:class 3 adenylate cyclase
MCHLAGEILVSTVVRDLVGGGPDVAFLERGDVELKGIEGPHRLFAVDLASSPTVS